LPKLLVVSGKSKASRGGLLTVKAAGGFVSASFKVILTMTLPPGSETLTLSTPFGVAAFALRWIRLEQPYRRKEHRQ
jgi:hypothetical protein